MPRRSTDPVPHHHIYRLCSRLGNDGEVTPRSRACQLESKTHDLKNPGTAEDRVLAIITSKTPKFSVAAAREDFFAVLAHENPIDIARSAIAQRSPNAW